MLNSLSTAFIAPTYLSQGLGKVWAINNTSMTGAVSADLVLTDPICEKLRILNYQENVETS